MGVALAMSLAACGSSTTEDAAASSSGAAAAGEGTTQYPLKLSSPWGETTLEKRPSRVAAVGWNDLQIVTALGVAPIAAPESSVKNEVWTQKDLTSKLELRFTTSSGNDALPPLEQIAATKPDLIVYNGDGAAKIYNQVSPIAPVVTSPTEADVNTPDWRLRLRNTAKALDLSAKGDEVIDGVDKHFEDIKKKYPEFAGKTVTMVVYYGPTGGLRYFSGEGSDTGKLFTSMGFATAPNAGKFTGKNLSVSAEQMNLLDSDVLIVSDNSGGQIGNITDSAAFKSLPVVAAGHAIIINNLAAKKENPEVAYEVNGVKRSGNLPWGLAQPGPQSTPWSADQLAPLASEVLKK